VGEPESAGIALGGEGVRGVEGAPEGEVGGADVDDVGLVSSAEAGVGVGDEDAGVAGAGESVAGVVLEGLGGAGGEGAVGALGEASSDVVVEGEGLSVGLEDALVEPRGVGGGALVHAAVGVDDLGESPDVVVGELSGGGGCGSGGDDVAVGVEGDGVGGAEGRGVAEGLPEE
jgi:hypothetical protein